jgi:hypothetical protein
MATHAKSRYGRTIRPSAKARDNEWRKLETPSTKIDLKETLIQIDDYEPSSHDASEQTSAPTRDSVELRRAELQLKHVVNMAELDEQEIRLEHDRLRVRR